MSTQNESQYMLFLRHPPGGAPPPAELQKIMAKFATWIAELKARRQFVATNGLDQTGKVLRGPRGSRPSDGPYIEAKEIVGGYILINAQDLDYATEIAGGCPGLDHGIVVEVRPVRPPAGA